MGNPRQPRSNNSRETMIGCEDICDEVIERLKSLGCDLGDHPSHTDVLRILREEIIFLKR